MHCLSIELGSSLDEAFDKLHEAETQLKAIVMRKFDEAVRDEDVASVERFFKIFPLLNQHNEGLKKFSTYLCSQVRIIYVPFLVLGYIFFHFMLAVRGMLLKGQHRDSFFRVNIPSLPGIQNLYIGQI